MPDRILRDWTDSANLEAVTPEGERLFVRLIMKVDDFGRFHGDSRLVKSACFPLIETLRTNEVDRWLDELSTRQLVLRYEVNGRKLLAIVNFGQRLRTVRAKFPQPTGKPADWLATCEDLSQNADIRQQSAALVSNPPQSAAIRRNPPQIAARREEKGKEGETEREGESENEKRTLSLATHERTVNEQSQAKDQPMRAGEDADGIHFLSRSAKADSPLHALMKRINSLRPEWQKPAHWNAAEMHGLQGGSANQMEELNDAEWELLARFMNQNLPQSKGFWQPRSRLKFVESFSDVWGSCMRWAGKSTCVKVNGNTGLYD